MQMFSSQNYDLNPFLILNKHSKPQISAVSEHLCFESERIILTDILSHVSAHLINLSWKFHKEMIFLNEKTNTVTMAAYQHVTL